MEMTPRLGLPLLIPGQIQRELYLNESLGLIDLLLNGSVEAGPIAAPPPAPVIGRLYRLAESGASGAFAGHDGALAGWTAGGWRFVAPVEGMRLTDQSSGMELAFRNGAWTTGSVSAAELVIGGAKVVGGRQPAIADAAGGSVIDVQLRSAVVQILAALRSHGLIAA